MRGIGFEFDPLFEVDQIDFGFVGRITQGHVGHQRVQQRRFSRAGLAGDQHVLRRSGAQQQRLQARGAGPAQRHVETFLGRAGPIVVGRRSDDFERHLDAAGRFGLLRRPTAACASSAAARGGVSSVSANWPNRSSRQTNCP